MDNVNGDKEITDYLFMNIYQSLYNSVPTSDTELVDLNKVIFKGSHTERLLNIVMTPQIVAQSKGNDDSTDENKNIII